MSKLNDHDLGELRTRQFWRKAEHLKMQAKVGQITCNVTDQRRLVSLPHLDQELLCQTAAGNQAAVQKHCLEMFRNKT